MYKISLLCPTRNRLKFVVDLITSAIETAYRPEEIEFVFYIDNDDNSYKSLVKKIIKRFGDEYNNNIKLIYGERVVLSQMWNVCYKNASANIYMHCGDDLRFRTEDWDKTVIDKFNEFDDKIAFLYGLDGLYTKEHQFGTHGFIHENWVKTIGYFVPPYFSSDFNDTWLNEVAHLIKRHIFIDIYTEHLHPCVGKHIWDKTHRERLERHKKDNVQELYDSMIDKRKLDAEKLQNFINNFKKGENL